VDPIPVARAKGIYFWTPEGKRFIDFNSQLMCVNIGHGDERVVARDPGTSRVLPYANPFMATEVRARLSVKLAEITPGDIDAFSSPTAAPRQRDAIRIARMSAGVTRLARANRSYQAATAGALTLTGDPRRWAAGAGHSRVFRVPDSTTAFKKGSETTEEVLARTEEILELEGAKTVAAIIVEPVSGPNGILFLLTVTCRVRALCDKIRHLLIADEVMAGFGRTGKWFSVTIGKSWPDLISMAKGLTSAYVQLGAWACDGHRRSL